MAVKRILINATYPEATRIAFTQGNNLTAFEVEHASEENTLRNIYKGKISAVNNSLECAFVDIGLERQGMLPFKRLNFRTDENRPQEEIDLLKAGSQLREGQQILVQVEKEPRGSKGASLTAQISIAGRNIVLKPGRPMRSITRAVKENVRNQLQNTANQLKIPDNFGVIMRTSAHRTKANEIQHEVDHLLDLCKEINKVQDNVNVLAPALIYKENNLVHRLFRDKFHRDITEVLVDNDEFYREAKQHAKEFYPQFASKVKRFQGSASLFEQFRVEQKVAAIYEREVQLPSGGSIVIDPTEALVTVDVNSGKAKGAETFSDTALQTNLEAAEELIRQLSIRNLGGLIVVDFIDMVPAQAKEVEDRVSELLEQDRASTAFCPISEFGLMEMQRQRLRRSIFDTDFETCEHCGGLGLVRTSFSTAWQVLRRIEQIVKSGRVESVDARVPHEVGMIIKNELTDSLSTLEKSASASIRILPTRSISAAETKITVYDGDRNQRGTQTRSYKLKSQLDNESQNRKNTSKSAEPQEPLVKYASPKAVGKSPRKRSRKPRKSTTKVGFFARLGKAVQSIFGGKSAQKQQNAKRTKAKGSRAKSQSKKERKPSDNASRTPSQAKKPIRSQRSKARANESEKAGRNNQKKDRATGERSRQRSNSRESQTSNQTEARASRNGTTGQPKSRQRQNQADGNNPQEESRRQKSDKQQSRSSSNQNRKSRDHRREDRDSAKSEAKNIDVDEKREVAKSAETDGTPIESREMNKRVNEKPRVEKPQRSKKSSDTRAAEQNDPTPDSTPAVAEKSAEDRPSTHLDLLNSLAANDPRRNRTSEPEPLSDSDDSPQRPKQNEAKSENEASETVVPPDPVESETPVKSDQVRVSNDPRLAQSKELV